MTSGVRSKHRFGAALAASLAIHVAAMALSLPAPRLVAFELAPLQVRLADQPPPPPAPVAEPAKPSTPLAAKSKAAKTPQVTKEPEAMQALEPATAPVAEPVVPATPPPPLTAARVPAVPTKPAALPEPPPVPVAELLAGYGKTISQTLARYKEYPRIAQMRGWEGAVAIELRLASSGRLLDVGLHISSGYPMLDEEALAMAARVERFPAPPEGLRDREIVLRVPVLFRLTP